jgi:hypothetical protein
MALEITINDFNSFLAGHVDEPEIWMEKNGFTTELVDTLGTVMVAHVIARILEGESSTDSIYNVTLSAFQMGWDAHKQFGGSR